MFSKQKGIDIVVLLVYNDDLLIIGNSNMLIVELKDVLQKYFKMKDLGGFEVFLRFGSSSVARRYRSYST